MPDPKRAAMELSLARDLTCNGGTCAPEDLCSTCSLRPVLVRLVMTAHDRALRILRELVEETAETGGSFEDLRDDFEMRLWDLP